MRRREFITLLGSAAVAQPLAVRAQQAVVPLIGFLDERSPEVMGVRLHAFHEGLKETGFVDGDNVSILYRFAENQADRLVGLAADLVQRNVTVIATVGVPAAVAVKAATTTIPALFVVPQDPVSVGLVASLARPGGNLTGINIFTGELTAKRFALMRELVPGVARVAVLVNPDDVANTKSTLQIVEGAARDMGLQIAVLNANHRRQRGRCIVRRGLGFPERPTCPTGPTGGIPSPPGNLSTARVHRGRRVNELRT